MKGEAWLRAETPAIVRATLIEKPGVAAKLLKRAKSPIIVVGHEAAEGGRIPDPGFWWCGPPSQPVPPS